MYPGWGEGAGTAGDGGVDGAVGSGLTVRHTARLGVCGAPPTRSRQCHSLHAGAPEARAQCRRRQGQARREAGCSGWMRTRPHAGAEASDSTDDSRPQQTVRGDPGSMHRCPEDRHEATEEAATQAGQEGPPESGVSTKRPDIQGAARRCHRVVPRGRADGLSGGWRVRARPGRCGLCCEHSGQPGGGAMLEPAHDGASCRDYIAHWVPAGPDRRARASAGGREGRSHTGRCASDQRRRERAQRSLRRVGAERRYRLGESSGRSRTGPRQEEVTRAHWHLGCVGPM